MFIDRIRNKTIRQVFLLPDGTLTLCLHKIGLFVSKVENSDCREQIGLKPAGQQAIPCEQISPGNAYFMADAEFLEILDHQRLGTRRIIPRLRKTGYGRGEARQEQPRPAVLLFL